MTTEKLASSFRDPSGFMFTRDGVIYRQVNAAYKDDYQLLVSSGLYQKLADSKRLIPHQEVDIPPADPSTAYKILQPEQIGFISYPYEWSFSQLKDAALVTLAVQKKAIEHGMILKDASAYNIQFRNGRPVFIDTLSFEQYDEGSPWQAYRQFCQHFLAPLALMSKCDIRLNNLLQCHIDGIPLDLASALLKKRTGLNFGLTSHIHWHARAQKRYESKSIDKGHVKMSKFSLCALIDSLESTVRGLKWTPGNTEWGDYYDNTNYTDSAASHKHQLLAGYLQQVKPQAVWDLGANTGDYSRIAAEMGIPTVAFDIDPAAVEKHYLDCKARKEQQILPLLLDLTNPSPSIGWAHSERNSFMKRGPADTVMALALIHHLAISNNLPLSSIASFFANVCSSALIVEFVPKEDSQVKRLLTTREDIFPDYVKEKFEAEFLTHFTIQEASTIQDSARTLYLMRRRSNQ